MKRFARSKSAVLVLLASFLLGSCIEIKQEVELDGDGSGEFEMAVIVPESDGTDSGEGFMSDEELETQAEASGVEILEHSTTAANGQVISKIRVAFDGVEELNAFMKKAGEEGNDAEFQFTLEEKDGKATLTHRVIPEEKPADNEEENGDEEASAAGKMAGGMAELMIANLLKDAYYEIRWTLPGKVVEATEGATIDGKSVSFKVPMVAMTKGSGVKVSATYEKGLPVWVFVLAGGLVLVVVVVMVGRRVFSK